MGLGVDDVFGVVAVPDVVVEVGDWQGLAHSYGLVEQLAAFWVLVEYEPAALQRSPV